MGESAVALCHAFGYVNAGTVEFMYEDGDYYFLEMNTRLQVEHCVTEMTTSIDLVAEQLRVASGEPLSFTQDSIERRGHAIECRINAEDPATGFMPSPGTLTVFDRPDGFGVRTDAGYAAGDTISQHYDNLIAKLICWGPDRDTAIARTRRALREFRIEGVRTTIDAQSALLDHADFRAACHSTKWLEEEVDPATLVSADGESTAAPASSPASAPRVDDLTERTVPVEVNGKRFDVKVWLPEAPAGGSTATAARAPKPVAATGVGGGPGGGTLSAPMQGTIVKVLVDVGDTVEPGQALLVLEAMKMENHLNAETGGEVREVRVSGGDTVSAGDVLVVIE